MPSAELGQAGRTLGHGFTLIEVVVAVVILSSALVASLAAYGAELRSLRTARDLNIAVELAEDRLATVELLARDRLTSLPDSLRRGTFQAPFADVRWEVEGESVLGTDLVELTVRVAWGTGEHVLTTVVARPPGPEDPR